MSEKNELLLRISKLIERLSRPLSEADMKNGWTKESQQAMLKMFSELQDGIKNNKIMDDVHISRGLDHWGVVGGDLLEDIAKLSVDLNEFKGKALKNSLKPKKSLLKKGVIVFIIGLLINSAFVALGVGGIIRELARFAVIVGLVMIVVGAVRK